MRTSSFLFTLCTLASLAIAPAHAQTSQEEVKATFVYRFVSFVSWPATSFEDATTPVRLCVVGADPFARTLSRVVADQQIGARRFEVRRIADASEMASCHAVYAVGDRAAAVLRMARQRPILVITDSVSGSERGIIHFALVEDRVRFYIDDAHAAESGLGIDPRLLNLALAVRRRVGA